jgi:glycerol-3-phosphate dehydrogenase (NAD+)
VGTTGPAADARVWCDVLRARHLGVRVCADGDAVELCGALKNVVALAAGFAASQGYGTNTLAALIRLGAGEMLRFIRAFHAPAASSDTLLESCGIADLITSCFGGRNARCAEAFIRTGRDWPELERELLGGQKLQGPPTCSAVQRVLRRAGCAPSEYPLFTATHAIMTRELPPTALVELHAPWLAGSGSSAADAGPGTESGCGARGLGPRAPS